MAKLRRFLQVARPQMIPPPARKIGVGKTACDPLGVFRRSSCRHWNAFVSRTKTIGSDATAILTAHFPAPPPTGPFLNENKVITELQPGRDW